MAPGARILMTHYLKSGIFSVLRSQRQFVKPAPPVGPCSAAAKLLNAAPRCYCTAAFGYPMAPQASVGGLKGSMQKSPRMLLLSCCRAYALAAPAATSGFAVADNHFFETA